MSSRPTVLVVGASGRTGRHVVAGLQEDGVRVRALVRRPQGADLPAGVTIAQGDLGKPDTVAVAADGADSAFLLWPEFDAEGAAPVVEALARHVRHVVYLSAALLQRDEQGPVDGVYADVERLVRDSGVDWTFVRAGGFAANALAWAPQVAEGNVVELPFPQAARSVVHERDIADVSVRALLDPTLRGQAFSVTGPEVLTQAEQVGIVATVIGRNLEVREQSVAQAHDELAAVMGTDFAERAIAHWADLEAAPERATGDVQAVTGHPARTFEQWVRDNVASFSPARSADAVAS